LSHIRTNRCILREADAREDVGRLPVVDPENPVRAVGYLRRAAILSVRWRLHEEEHVREKV